MAGCASLDLEAGGAGAAVCDIISVLRERLGARGEFLSDTKLLVAVNHGMADAGTAVKDGDEVAFFPPVTGG